MSAKYDIGFEEAFSRMLEQLKPLTPVSLPVEQVSGLTAAEDCIAVVDCPSTQTSLKDGYAVSSADLKNTSKDRPAKLKVLGQMVAGGQADLTVESGMAVKILTGSRLPHGADTVIPEELTKEQNGWVFCHQDNSLKRNILEQGYDVKKGELIAQRGEILTPAKTGLIAAGGLDAVRVHKLPRTGIIAIGDEVVAPGKPLKEGQLYASNSVTLLSWLRHFRMEAEIAIVPDQKEKLRNTIQNMLEHNDVITTSGGVWKSDRDLTVKTFTEMGGKIIFHRIRMGPGKAVAMITLNDKTVFCLPGGPPSNEMAFLQIALPGLFHLAGRSPVPFEHKTATLTTAVKGDIDWTQFIYAKLTEKDDKLFVSPLKMNSRIQTQANANALIKIPECMERFEENNQIQVQVLFDNIYSPQTIS
ncbi:MAG: molybdopterin molybdotransferase MoeA [Phycisphaerales bacterium]|jgi:molybdopterin molybdotransferase